MENRPHSKWLLNPMDRASEILFGLFMALTFTCSIGIANAKGTEIRQLMIGAVTCNLAWGIVDATMYLIGVLAQKQRSKHLLEQVQKTADAEAARKSIAQALPGTIGSVIKTEELEQLRKELLNLSGETINVRLNLQDIKRAIALFFLMICSTFPVIIPFVFMRNTQLALRISNLVAILMMFLCGWSLARYVGFNKWKMGITMIVVGVLLVVITILLGG